MPTYYNTNYNFSDQKVDNNIINEDKSPNNKFSNDNIEINIDKKSEIILEENNIKKMEKINKIIEVPKKENLDDKKIKKEDLVKANNYEKINELLKDKTEYKIIKDELRDEIKLKFKFLEKKKKKKN